VDRLLRGGGCLAVGSALGVFSGPDVARLGTSQSPKGFSRWDHPEGMHWPVPGGSIRRGEPQGIANRRIYPHVSPLSKHSSKRRQTESCLRLELKADFSEEVRLFDRAVKKKFVGIFCCEPFFFVFSEVIDDGFEIGEILASNVYHRSTLLSLKQQSNFLV